MVKEYRIRRIRLFYMKSTSGYVNRFKFLAENYPAWAGLNLIIKPFKNYHQFKINYFKP